MIQAYIFAMLALMYISSVHEEEENLVSSQDKKQAAINETI